jgi:hypothetical protein
MSEVDIRVKGELLVIMIIGFGGIGLTIMATLTEELQPSLL